MDTLALTKLCVALSCACKGLVLSKCPRLLSGRDEDAILLYKSCRNHDSMLLSRLSIPEVGVGAPPVCR